MVYAFLLALITLTGYIYCQLHPSESRKLAWHAKRGGLHYRYLTFGSSISLLGYALFYILDRKVIIEDSHVYGILSEVFKPLQNYYPSFSSIHYLAIGVLSLSIFLAVLLSTAGVLSKYLSEKYPFKLIYKEREINKEIVNSDDSFSRLLLLAMNHRLSVMVTLRSNKVYIGQVLEFYSPFIEHSWFQIFPIVSGYRDELTQELVLTTDYIESINTHIDKQIYKIAKNATQKKLLMPRYDDFSQTLRFDEITAVTIFDLANYANQVKPNQKSNAE